MKNSPDTSISKNHEHALFKVLYNKYYTPLCHYANKYICDTSIAEEIVQDIFIKLWKNRKIIGLDINIKAYLYKAVYNEAINSIRRKTVENKYRQHILYENKNNYYDEYNTHNTDELFKFVQKRMTFLPKKCSQILKLSKLGGLSYKEIASKYEMSVKSVEYYMTKALKTLRYELKEYAVH